MKPKAKSPATKSKKPAKKSTPRANVAPPEPSVNAMLSGDALLTALTNACDDVKNLAGSLRPYLPSGHDLTPAQRRRLVGAKAGNYGFIVKAYETVDDRPEFIPHGLSMTDMAGTLANLDKARDLLVLAENFQRLVDDLLLQTTDLGYHNGLLIYGNLQNQARGRIHGAEDLFDQLRQFFKKRRRNPDAEPTEKQLEREAKQLLKGKADGEMVIKHESPHLTGGVHEVVENVGKRRKRGAEIKVKEEE